eukprot:6191430-Pleurochrysis_carterae.AAC.2
MPLVVFPLTKTVRRWPCFVANAARLVLSVGANLALLVGANAAIVACERLRCCAATAFPATAEARGPHAAACESTFNVA